MPTLEWIGKDKVISHHQEVPYRILKRKYSCDKVGQHNEDNGSENMIIHGDNLEALKALLPKFEGKIKCIYIDPPYNTGNEGWCYNDNVNDPKIQKWLGEIVGKEGEDLSRHDKWLCMMYPRLRLLQKLLCNDGCMIISISYHELHNLLLICREIFATRQVVTVTVQTSGGKPSGGFNYQHEYLVFIVPREFEANSLEFCGGKARTPFEGLTLSTFNKVQRPNQTYPIFIDPNTESIVGVGKSLQALINEGIFTVNKEDFKYDYSIAPEGTIAVWPITNKGKECVWRQIPDRLLNDWIKGYIKVSKNRNESSLNEYSIQYLPDGVIKKIQSGKLDVLGTEPGAPTLKFGINHTVGSQVPTLWLEKQFYTVNGTQELKAIFPELDKAFDYPKSVDLIMSVLQSIMGEDDIVLDSFAGSGTTAHAILNMNKTNGKRKFILVEMENYADSITAERVKRVIYGYGDVEGTGGDFSYYELGEPLLLANGNLNENVDVQKIRDYVYYMETKESLAVYGEVDNSYYLGKNKDTVYYFYYEKNEVTTLEHAFLSTIGEKADGYTIYADLCTLSESELKRYNITFKKIPRDIARL
jgi:adenine-specific DNA-methyltransferase